MKKLVAAGLALALVLSTPLAAMAWIEKKLNVGMTIDVNNTFKVTQNTKKEATLEGTIYKNPAVIILGKDDSMDWSDLTDKAILKALTSESGKSFKGFKVVSEGEGGIGEYEGRYAAFDAIVEGKKMHGYLSFSVVEGNLYSVIMLYGVGGEKTEDVAAEIVGSADLVE